MLTMVTDVIMVKDTLWCYDIPAGKHLASGSVFYIYAKLPCVFNHQVCMQSKHRLVCVLQLVLIVSQDKQDEVIKVIHSEDNDEDHEEEEEEEEEDEGVLSVIVPR